MSHHTQATSAPSASKSADHPVFGLTVTQLDDLRRYVAFLVADGDMLMNAPAPCDAMTVPTLGENIYETALTTRAIIDTLEEQRLSPPPGADDAATAAALFISHMHTQLREAQTIARLLRTALDMPDGDRAVPGISLGLFDMLGRLVEEVESHVAMEASERD